jgi:cytosol alanyl aminopeptidase
MRRSIVLLAVTILFTVCGGLAAQPPAPDPDLTPPALRLPAGVRPARYDVDLFIDPEAGSFHGEVGIDLRVDAPTRVIWLHGKDLSGLSARVGDREAEVHAVEPGFLAVVTAEPVAAGAARLSLRFAGTLDSTRAQGLYRVAEPDGKQYAYTFFEPIDARRAFPCFDEPSFKVPWKLTLRTPDPGIAVANAPLAAERKDGTTRIFEFAETPPLPSYLVAFVVGPFEVVEAGTAGRHGTPLRFIVPPGHVAELAYAKEVSPAVVGLLEDWFAMPYPFTKLDVAVVPRYWGTMEHPGIVAMGQSLTLIKPEEDTALRRIHYANILAHELAHYWFGDYVTMAWWDETWLNEGLGTWMDIKITEAIEPAWKYGRNRQGSRQKAMGSDSLASAKAMRQPVRERTGITSSFDANLTYYKGASILWMFERWAGVDVFQRGVRAYLKKHAWGNTVTEDLLAVLSAEAGRDFAPAMKSFIDQPGVPEIAMSLSCAAGARPVVTLAQRRYRPLGSPEAPGAAQARWSVPICLRWGRGAKTAEKCDILDTARAEWPVDGVGGCPDWLLGNAGGAGYYHTAYSEPLRKKLVAGFGTLTRDADERRALVADLIAQVDAGTVGVGEALALAPALLADTDFQMVKDSLRLFDLIDRDALPDPLLANYQRTAQKLLGARAREIGWRSKPGEAIELQELRPDVVRRAALEGEDEPLHAEARNLAKVWLTDRKAVDSDMDDTILLLAARRGDAALFDAFLAEAQRTDDRENRTLLFTSLGGFEDPKLLARALDLLLDPKIDLRDSGALLRTAMGRRETREEAWAFFKQNFTALAGRMRDDEKSYLIMLAGAFCDAAHRDEVKAFLTGPVSHVDGGPMRLAMTLEGIDQCIATRERNAPGIAAFLKEY